MESRPVGGEWLKDHFKLSQYTLTHSSYIADNVAICMTSKGNIEQDYGIKYAVADENNPVHHIEFFLNTTIFSLTSYRLFFRGQHKRKSNNL